VTRACAVTPDPRGLMGQWARRVRRGTRDPGVLRETRVWSVPRDHPDLLALKARKEIQVNMYTPVSVDGHV